MELEVVSRDEAKWAYQEALRLEPVFLDAHMHLGLLDRRDGQLRNADRCDRKVIKAAPP